MADLTTKLAKFLDQLYAGVVGGTGNGVSAWTFTLGTSVVEEAVNILALRNGTNPQVLRVYNTYTDGSNYERLNLRWTTNLLVIDTEAAGTGTARALKIGGASATIRTSNTDRWDISSTGTLTSAGNWALGYGTGAGAGGTVTQLTSKATGVTLNTVTGQITMDAASLGAATSVSFTMTDSAIAAGDYVMVQHVSAGTLGAYVCQAVAAAGSASITVTNRSAGALLEAIVIKFVVFKASNS